jgi:hypothetical protein
MIVDNQGCMTLLIAGDLHSDSIADDGVGFLRGLENGN